MLVDVRLARRLRPEGVEVLVGRVADHLEVVVVRVARPGGIALVLSARLLGHEHHVVWLVLQDVARGLLLARRALQVSEDAVLLLLHGRIWHRLALRVEPADDRPLAELDLLARLHVLPPDVGSVAPVLAERLERGDIQPGEPERRERLPLREKPAVLRRWRHDEQLAFLDDLRGEPAADRAQEESLASEVLRGGRRHLERAVVEDGHALAACRHLRVRHDRELRPARKSHCERHRRDRRQESVCHTGTSDCCVAHSG